MSRIAALAGITAVLLLASGVAFSGDLARPDPTMTPGAVDPHVTLADICTGHTKERRHVSPATRAKVLRDYNVSDAASVGMEMDHLIPLALGGANTAANLWPQPAPNFEHQGPTVPSLLKRCSRAPARSAASILKAR